MDQTELIDYVQLGRELSLEALDHLQTAIAKAQDARRNEAPMHNSHLDNDPYFRAQINELEKLERQTINRIKLNLHDLNQLPELVRPSERADETDQNDADFLRLKIFVDAVALPMQQSIEKLYRRCTETCQIASKISERLDQLDGWRRVFVKNVQDLLNAFVKNLRRQFDAAIVKFVDNHYDKPNVESDWKARVERMDIIEMCRNFLRQLSDEAAREMFQININLSQELKRIAADLDVPKLPSNDLNNYSNSLHSITAPPIAELSVGLVEELISFLFIGKEQKISRQKNNLRAALVRSCRVFVATLEERLVQIINDVILNRQLNLFRAELLGIKEALFRLAYNQCGSANVIGVRYSELNFNLMVETLNHVGNPIGMQRIVTARRVGEEILFFSLDRMDDTIRDKASALLGEKISAFQVNDKNYWDDVKSRVEEFVFGEEFSYVQFLEREYGKMQLLIVPDQFKDSPHARLLEQLFSSPSI